MGLILFVVYCTLFYALEAVSILMLIRAVLSWFPGVAIPKTLSNIIYGATEFFITPVRTFLRKFDFARRCIFDLPFLATYILIHVVQSLLSALYYGIMY